MCLFFLVRLLLFFDFLFVLFVLLRNPKETWKTQCCDWIDRSLQEEWDEVHSKDHDWWHQTSSWYIQNKKRSWCCIRSVRRWRKYRRSNVSVKWFVPKVKPTSSILCQWQQSCKSTHVICVHFVTTQQTHSVHVVLLQKSHTCSVSKHMDTRYRVALLVQYTLNIYTSWII